MPSYEPFDWYQTPVYYDIIFDTETAAEADFLEKVHARYAQDKRPTGKPLYVLEPACGSGRLMAELAGRGHKTAGLDLSQGMLDFAKTRIEQQGVKGKLAMAPMQDFDLHTFAQKSGGYDLAHILVSSFKYLQTEADAAASLRCICDHLRPGGIFVLGVHMSEYEDRKPALERWRAKREGLDVICTIRSWPADRKTRTERVRSRIVARSHEFKEPRRFETQWDFRTYDDKQLKSLLRKEPRFKHLATYTFHHDINIQTSLDGDDLGVVLVLRRES